MHRFSPAPAKRAWLAISMAMSLAASAAIALPAAVLADDEPPALEALDPQVVTQAADQTWDDYKPIPGSPYADLSIAPSITRWDVALILTDFPGTPFAVTQPQGSTIFGNPGALAHDLPREAVPAFYRDWLNVPSAMNEFQGMNRYWMEDTYGKYGVNLEGFGPYLLPKTQDEYFITDFTNTSFCNTQTRTTTAQAGVLDVEVVSSNSFSVGKRVTGLSGTRVVTEIPDATHLRTGAATTLAAASAAGATNIRVAAVTGLAVGHTLDIGFDDRFETVTITSVGTAGATGTGVNVTPPLAFAHANTTIVNDMNATAISVGANSFVHTCFGNSYRTDSLIAWTDHVSAAVRNSFDNTFYVAAGQDESGTWQEFGEMQFLQNTVPDEYGPPNPEIPQNWAGTRYIPWTSWVSAATIWPSASGTNSIEGEGSGMAVYAHELTHNLGIADNYNNPYAAPFQRAATGYWSMMSRGSFGGPGGTHTRWNIPSTRGTSLGSQHVLRDKIKLGFVTAPNFVDLNRNALMNSGLAVVDVVAREVNPGANNQAGIRINLDGAAPADKNLSCTVFTTSLAAATAEGDTNIKVASVGNITVGTDIVVGNAGNDEVARVQAVGTAGAGGTGVTLAAPLSKSHPGGETVSNRLTCSGSAVFNNYMVEVVDQIGSDSFQADSGVLISKNKTAENSSCGTFSCFSWIIDSHPTDINMVDFIRPDGTTQMVTTGDPRQLTDAPLHAGLKSGSMYEWEDTRNGLHFYVVDRMVDEDGILRYRIAVQNINGNGPHTRGVSVDDTDPLGLDGRYTYCDFDLTNTGEFSSFTNTHPAAETPSGYVSNDVFRLSTSASGDGWSAELRNALAAAEFGATISVPVYVTRTADSSAAGSITLTATSVSDPTKSSTGTCLVDTAGPSISIVAPEDGGSYAYGSTQLASYSCDDPDSGLASCVGTVADGSAFDTSTVGTHTFTVDAADLAGKTSSKTVEYNVFWSGWSGFRPPTSGTGTNSAKAGAVVPVKFSLGGDFGLSIFAAGSPASQQVDCSTLATIGALQPTTAAGGTGLSYADGQYTYAWKTESGWKGQCRQLSITLIDNTTHTALFAFK